MKKEDFYEWPEESFEDKVEREMAMSVWERPTMTTDWQDVLFCSFDRHYHGQKMVKL